MEHDKALELMRRSWAEEKRFFSNHGRADRERWVVEEFLTHLGVIFSVDEIASADLHSKIDVAFRDARFQVKEIVTPGTRRGDEIEALWKQAEAATRVEEVVGHSYVYDIPPCTRAYDLVSEEAKSRSTSGKYEPGTLDLLIYVTRINAAPIQPHEINLQQLSAYGWRSISYLMGVHALVLYAGDDAPALLYHRGTGS